MEIFIGYDLVSFEKGNMHPTELITEPFRCSLLVQAIFTLQGKHHCPRVPWEGEEGQQKNEKQLEYEQ